MAKKKVTVDGIKSALDSEIKRAEEMSHSATRLSARNQARERVEILTEFHKRVFG